MKWWLILLSYLTGVSVEKTHSTINPYLEVRIEDGRYILNSRHANYSYEGLQVAFDKEFGKLEMEKRDYQKVLILGFGVGSVVELLQHKYHYHNTNFICIECDSVVIELGKKYFEIDKLKNTDTIVTDALNYVKKCSETFDMIIVDLYIDRDVPEKFQNKKFLTAVKEILSPTGLLLYNKLVYNKETSKSADNLAGLIKEVFGHVHYSKVNKTMLRYDGNKQA